VRSPTRFGTRSAPSLGAVATALPVERTTDPAPDDAATRAFSISILISAVRCVLTYVVFPWVLPAVGVAGGVGPGIGLVVGVVAIASNVASIRRFWAADHRWKKPITVLNVAVIVLVTILVAQDIADLL
jgi:hypothetical protein